MTEVADLQLGLTTQHVEHRTVGPPGTGKTTWLSRQAKNATMKYGTSAVAICSLTRAAATEVGGRDTGIPAENIGTLHAHAYRALDRPSMAETSEGVAAWNEVCGSSAWKLSHRGGDLDRIVDQQTTGNSGDEILAQLSNLRAAMTPADKWPPHVIDFAAAWSTWKDASNRLDFTDLIEHAVDSVPHMPSYPKIMMVDEAQDMSALEMKLARKWGEAAEQLVIVGDPDQSLYTWRGADPRAVFGDDLDRLRILAQSYRVPAAVHEAAVAMIDRIPGRLPVEYRPRVDEHGQQVRGELEEYGVQYADPGPLAELCRRELDDGRTVMVLTSCGYMLNPLVAMLKQQGVPFHNPYRVTQGAWNPLSGAGRLLALLRPIPEVWGDESRMWTWDDLRLLTEPMQAKGNVQRGMKTWIDHKCTKDRFGDSEADETITLRDLQKVYEDEAAFNVANSDIRWWHDSLRHADHKRQAFSVNVALTRGGKALREEPRLIVGTIHSVKGAEADTVIMLPDLSAAGYWQGLKTSGEAHDSVIRQAYVGMTRAKEKLILGQASGIESIDW